MKLIVKESSWSGWSRDYKPVEIEHEYGLEIGKKIIVKTIEVDNKKNDEYVKSEIDILSFEINEIGEDYIKINTNESFSDNSDYTINFNINKKEFIIRKNKETKLITPTMDFGYIFIFNLID